MTNLTDLDSQRTEPTPRELAALFVSNFRGHLGMDQVEPTSIREGLGDRVKIYRYHGGSSVFAITSDPLVRDALIGAGGMRPIPFKMVPTEAKDHYDVTLPSYLWSFV